MTLTYGDLFDFILEKCDFQGEGEDITWKCSGGNNRPFLKEFFDKHNVDKETRLKVELELYDTGGHCDCEIIWNSERQISREKRLKM